jgi:hypothetical protein
MGISKYGSVTNLIGMACWSFTKDDFKGSAGWTVITRKSYESERLVHAFTIRVENGCRKRESNRSYLTRERKRKKQR